MSEVKDETLSGTPQEEGDDANVPQRPRNRRDGLTYPVPQWWLDDLTTFLELNGWTDRKLAEEAGIGSSNVSRLRKGQYPESKDVGPICRVTGLRYPVLELPPTVQDFATVARDLALLDPDAVEAAYIALRDKLDAVRKARKK